MDNAITMNKRGITAPGDENTHLQGFTKKFPDRDPSDPMTRRTESDVECMWVLNDSGGALLPGRHIKFKAGYRKKRVGGYAGAGDVSDGVVDEFLNSAGVADGRHFWICRNGNTTMITDGNASISESDLLVTAANGKVREQNASPADAAAALVQANTLCGRAGEDVTNVDGTAFVAELKTI